MDSNKVNEEAQDHELLDSLINQMLPRTLFGASVYPNWRMPLLFCYLTRESAEGPEDRYVIKCWDGIKKKANIIVNNGADRHRVERVLERIAKWMPSHASEDLVPPWEPCEYQWWPGLHYLDLELAIQHLGSDNGLALFEHNPLHELDSRASFTSFLHCIHTPLYSLAELATLIDNFKYYLEDNFPVLIKSGYPEYNFKESFWLGNLMGQLCYTHFPDLIIMPPDNPADPQYIFGTNEYSEWPDKKDICIPIVGSNWPGAFRSGERIYLPEWEAAKWNLDSTPVMERCCLHEFKPENISSLSLLSRDDVDMVVALRENLYKAKLSILTILADALRKKNATNLFDDCLNAMAEQINADEVEFLLEIENLETGYDFPIDKPSMWSDIVPLGGVTDILCLIGHCEKEIEIGTYAQIRDCIADIVYSNFRYPRLSVSNYYELLKEGYAQELDAAYSIVQSSYRDELDFWTHFVERSNLAISEEFQSAVIIVQYVKKKHELKFRRSIESFTGILSSNLELTGECPMISTRIDVSTIQQKPWESDNIFRKNGDMWSLKFDGQTTNVRNLDGMYYIKMLLESPGEEMDADRMYYTLHPAENGNISQRINEMNENVNESDHKFLTGIDKISCEELIADYQFMRSIGSQLEDPDDRSGYMLAVDERQECLEAMQDAFESGNEELLSRLRKKRDAYDNYLRRFYDHKGRPRAVSDPIKSYRQTVSKAIGYAQNSIKAQHPSLATHLKTIKTGTCCVYSGNLKWQTDELSH